MGCSKLASGKALTDKYNSRNGNQVCRITPHQMIAHWTGETAATWFRDNGCENSVNYCIGYDGSIWQNVDEDYRAWTSSSRANDELAITVELSNNEDIYSGQMTDATIEAFINLCVDLIERFPGLGGKFNYTGNTNGNITLHEWFAATDCPGAWFKAKLPWIQKQVNAKLKAKQKYTSKNKAVASYIKGKTVKQVEAAFKPVFNSKYYKEKYPAIAKAQGSDTHSLLQYFLNEGMEGNQQGAAKFDPTYFEQENTDLAEVFETNWPKYYIWTLMNNKKEKRRTYLFLDVPADGKYYKYIKYCTDNELIKLSTRFGLDLKMTKKAVAVYIYRLAGKPAVKTGTIPFTDVDKLSLTHKKAIYWCYEQGIIKGYADGTYRPEKIVVKKTFMIYLWRLAGKPEVKGTISFKDIDAKKGSEVYKALVWCEKKKISHDSGDTFNPKKSLVKKMLAIYMYRYKHIN